MYLPCIGLRCVQYRSIHDKISNCCGVGCFLRLRRTAFVWRRRMSNTLRSVVAQTGSRRASALLGTPWCLLLGSEIHSFLYGSKVPATSGHNRCSGTVSARGSSTNHKKWVWILGLEALHIDFRDFCWWRFGGGGRDFFNFFFLHIIFHI